MLRYTNKLRGVIDQITTPTLSSSSFVIRQSTSNLLSNNSASTNTTITMSNKNKKSNIKSKAQLPQLSQCAAALQGNRFYSTKPGFKPAPYLGPPGTLNEIVKLELIQKEPADKVKEIWVRYHAKKDCICAVIPADVYNKLRQRALSCPLFVFPLPGDKGYISILYQWQENHFMYTYLEQYKKHTVNAVPWLSAAHYTDLIDSHGIVLMRAEPNLEVLNSVQAQFLYNQTQMFLLDDKKFNLMQTFTYNPQRFDFNAVLKEINSQKSILEEVDAKNLNKVVEFENSVKPTAADAITSESTSNTTEDTTTKVSASDTKEEKNDISQVTIENYKVKPSLNTTSTSSSSSLD